MNVKKLIEFIKKDKQAHFLCICFMVLLAVVSSQAALIKGQHRDISELTQKKSLVFKYLKHTQVAKSLDSYRLTGISKEGERPLAVINDEVYSLNDRMDEYFIKEISENSVTLQNIKTSKTDKIYLYSPSEISLSFVKK